MNFVALSMMITIGNNQKLFIFGFSAFANAKAAFLNMRQFPLEIGFFVFKKTAHKDCSN